MFTSLKAYRIKAAAATYIIRILRNSKRLDWTGDATPHNGSRINNDDYSIFAD